MYHLIDMGMINVPEESAAGDKKKKGAKNADNPLSRIPGLRDASKRTAKIVSNSSSF